MATSGVSYWHEWELYLSFLLKYSRRDRWNGLKYGLLGGRVGGTRTERVTFRMQVEELRAGVKELAGGLHLSGGLDEYVSQETVRTPE